MARNQSHDDEYDDADTAALVPVANPLDLTAKPPPFWTSLDMSTPFGRALAIRVGQRADEKLQDHLGKELLVSNIYCQSVTIAKESTGEIIDCVRTVLIDPDGKSYGCVSDGIRQGVMQLMGILGNPPWNPALKLTPRQVGTRRGNRTFILDYAEGDLPAAPKSKKKD